MNNISQISIFEYREIENLGDLERLKIFFENINDEKLCEKLEKSRKNGRNDYPVRTMLNLINLNILSISSLDSAYSSSLKWDSFIAILWDLPLSI